jgi:hypothetical protein
VKRRSVFVVLAATAVMSSAGGSAQAMPVTASISGAPALISVGPGSYSPATAQIYYYHARGLPDSGQVTWAFSNASIQDMSVTDSTGLNLFSTGLHHSPYNFSFDWKWAGSYPTTPHQQERRA